MVLTTVVKYKQSIVTDRETLTPNKVLLVLQDVRRVIGELQPAFRSKTLKEVLETIPKKRSEPLVIEGDNLMGVDLSAAQAILDAYREDSEGGCQSCRKLGRNTDAKNATPGWYCKVSDPEKVDATGDLSRVHYAGFSKKVRNHYGTPCENREPKFPKTLVRLVEAA